MTEEKEPILKHQFCQEEPKWAGERVPDMFRDKAGAGRGIAQLFKALADENRVRIAYILLYAGESCVCNIAEAAGISVAAASHHLRGLYMVGLARYEKKGKYVYYSLDDDHVVAILKQAESHWNHVGESGK